LYGGIDYFYPPTPDVNLTFSVQERTGDPLIRTVTRIFGDSRTIPVIFLNLTGYDMHFLMKDIATRFEGLVDLLALNMEKYISITKHIPDRFQMEQTAIHIR